MVAIANDVKNNNAQTPVDNQNNDTQQQQNLQDNFNKTIEGLKGKENNPKPNNDNQKISKDISVNFNDKKQGDNQTNGEMTKSLVVQTSSLNQTSDNITPTSVTNFDGTPATQRSDGSIIRNNEDGTQTLIDGDISVTYPKGYEIPPILVEKQTRGIEDGEKPSLTTEQAADKIIANGRLGKWDKDVVTYHLSDDMSNFEKQQARKAFEEWNKITGIEIREISQGEYNAFVSYMQGNGGHPVPGPNIFFGYGETGPKSAGHTSNTLSMNSNGDLFIERSDITINSRYREGSNLEEGEYGYLTYVHEIGHSLGLSHPGKYNAYDEEKISYENNAEYEEDTKRYSIMSYFNANDDRSGTNYYTNYPSAPMLHDVTAVQKLYGKNETTNNDNTIYYFTPETTPERTVEVIDHAAIDESGRWDEFTEIANKHSEIAYEETGTRGLYGKYKEAFEQEIRETFPEIGFKTVTYPERPIGFNKEDIKTLYDTGGIDTIDTTQYEYQKQTINLNAGTYSSIGGMTNNIAIAEGVVIENVITGDGDNTIIGNDANNRIETGNGTDIVDVGNGSDTIVDGEKDDEYILDNNYISDNDQFEWTGSYGSRGNWDDEIVFTYKEDGYNGEDTIRNFNAKYDKITLRNIPEGQEVTYTQDGDNVLIDYGAGRIIVTNANAEEVKNFGVRNVIAGDDGNNNIETTTKDDIVESDKGYDTIVDNEGNDSYTLDNGQKFRWSGAFGSRTNYDDNIVFTYKEGGFNGEDTIHNFNTDNDRITIKDLPDGREIIYTQEGSDVLIDYGAGIIRIANVDLNKFGIHTVQIQ